MKENTLRITINNKYDTDSINELSNFNRIQNFFKNNAHHICGCRPSLSSNQRNYYFFDNSLIVLLGDPYNSEIELFIYPKNKSSENIDKLIEIIDDSILKKDYVNLNNLCF